MNVIPSIGLPEEVVCRGVSDEHLKLLLSYCADSIDSQIQTNLDSDLMARYADVSRQLEEKNRQLIRSEAGLQEAQRIAQLGSWDVAMADQKLRISDAMREILEFDKDSEPSFELYLTRVHPDDYEEVSRRIDGLKKGIAPDERQYRLRMQDGRVKWVHTRCMVLYGEGQKPIEIHGTLQDITAAKLAEEKLKKYNDHLEELVHQKVEEISASQMATIHALVKLAESRDDDTGDHIERTSGYCRLIAEKLRETDAYRDVIDDAFVENMATASPLHDIGKVGIPDAILLKPGRLTDEEFQIMKTHVTLGYETLASVEKLYPANAFLRFGMEIARYHHEKWDGSGYVDGLAGEAIPLPARIMALADVYDALRSKRVYKDAFPHEKASEIIAEGRGRHFDPALADVFLKNDHAFRDIFDRSSDRTE